MKLTLILTVFLTAVLALGYYTFSKFKKINFYDKPPESSQAESSLLPKKETPLPSSAPVPVSDPRVVYVEKSEVDRTLVKLEPFTFFDPDSIDQSPMDFKDVLVIPPDTSQVIGRHKFVNRKVPALPPNFNATNEFTLFVDAPSNSWVWSIPKNSKIKVAEYALAVDIPSSFYDLDFVFVAVSQEYLNSLGFGIAFSEGNFLNTFDGFFTAQGMNLVYDGFSAFIDWENADSHIRVVSTPVVRVETSQEFNFSTVERIPYSTTSVSDGVALENTQFITAGFSLTGNVIDMGHQLRLELTQTNGTPVESAVSDIPTVDEQTLSTSSSLTLNTWTLLGGSRTTRYSKSKGLFRKRETQSDDILYVFVRPRDQVRPIPRAIVVDPHELTNFGHLNDDDFMSGDSLLPSPPVEILHQK